MRLFLLLGLLVAAVVSARMGFAWGVIILIAIGQLIWTGVHRNFPLKSGLPWYLSWVELSLAAVILLATLLFGYRLFTPGGIPETELLLLAASASVGTFLISDSALALGTNWHPDPTRVVSTKVVRHGPYALVRHPMYVGLWFNALTILWGSGILYLQLPTLLVLSWYLYIRACIEERHLENNPALGDEYREYARHVPRFIPTLGTIARYLLSTGDEH